MKEFYLDTNVYRYLVRDLTLDEVYHLSKKINKSFQEKSYTTGIPIPVAMELISHLTVGDPHCEECYKALCLLYEQSKNVDKEQNKISGVFYPPMDEILSVFFFIKTPPILRFTFQ